MREVSIPVHPLSRRVLLCEYGAEPLIFPNHDFHFRLLTSSPIQFRAKKNAQKLTSSIRLLVDEPFAQHLEKRKFITGLTLLGFHWQIMCRYADAALRLHGFGKVKSSIEQWLLLHNVDENEYAADTAYKLWQRHSWKIEEKNSVFFGQSRSKSARSLSKKSRIVPKPEVPLNNLCQRLPEMQIELLAARFVASLTSCFRRPPKKIEQHARIYYYMQLRGLTCRATAAKLGITKSTACYAYNAIERRANQNRTFEKLLREAMPCALPH